MMNKMNIPLPCFAWLRTGLIRLVWLVSLVAGSCAGFALYLGASYIDPKNKPVSPPPMAWPVEELRFHNDALAGWFVPAEGSSNGVADGTGRSVHKGLESRKPSKCILLLHGFKGSRTGLIPIARFLRDAGFSLFLFDFRGHGESKPDLITFGYRESEDAHAAMQWLQEHGRCSRIGVWGHSMGAASAVLGKDALPADAFVFDSMYASIEEATQHRMLNSMGHPLGEIFSPLLLAQLPWRLNVDAEQLRPIDAIAKVSAPSLIIYGTHDYSAYPAEAKALFAASGSVAKEIWEVQGATHGSTHSTSPDAYEIKVVTFFKKYL